LPATLEIGGVAIEGAQTKGAMSTDRALSARGLGKFLARRDALAIILTVVLWLVGFYLRPDYWAGLPNSFAVLLNFTEVALIAIGLTYVIAAGDIDLSGGSANAAGTKAMISRSDDTPAPPSGIGRPSLSNAIGQPSFS
ncbi:MAG: hypothetical protein ACXWLE_02195, partial [Rhizomicrobium sp.]